MTLPSSLGRRGALTAVLFLLGAAYAPLHAQSVSPSFTAQAVRGARAYRAKCQDCHGRSLEGSESGPPLGGAYFAEQWGAAPVGDLFEVISTTMPAGRPRTLMPAEAADSVAYILCRNGPQPGAAPLTTDPGALGMKIPRESAVACAIK